MNVNQDIQKLIEPLKDQVQHSLGGWLGDQSSNMSERLNHISSAFHKMAEELENQQENELARLAHSGADSLEEVASKVHQNDPKHLMEVIEEQGRSHPAGAFLSSMVAGFLSSRVTKLSVEKTSSHPSESVSQDLSEAQSMTSDTGSGLDEDRNQTLAQPAGSTSISSTDTVEPVSFSESEDIPIEQDQAQIYPDSSTPERSRSSEQRNSNPGTPEI